MKLDSEVIYLVGNKVDLENERQVSFDVAKKVKQYFQKQILGFKINFCSHIFQLADRNSMKYFESSAKTSLNLFEIFKSLASDLLYFNDMSKVSVLTKKSLIKQNFKNVLLKDKYLQFKS